MTLQGTVDLGPVSLPAAVAVAVVVILAAWAAGAVPLIRKPEDRKTFGDLFTTLPLVFLLGWKFSLIFTDAADVVADPLILLYSSGSRANILIGAAAALAGTGFRWFRGRSSPAVNAAMLRSTAVLIILTSAVAVIGRQGPPESATVTDRESFQLIRPDGTSWNLSMAEGKPVILNFWASWCPPCRAEMPMLVRVAGDERFEGVVFFTVNAAYAEKNAGAGIDWLAANGLEPPLLLDASGATASVFGLTGLPSTVILDTEGRVANIIVGAVSRRRLLMEIRRVRRRTGK